MEIIKKENGNVELRDGGQLVWSMPQLPTEIRPVDKDEEDHVKLFQSDGRVEYLNVADITETQVEPAAAIPFSGTVFDLADLLSADFFFEVAGGYSGDEYIDDYFYSVSVTNADTYPFLVHAEAIPLDNAISFEAEVLAFRTDAIGQGRRISYARFGGNDGGVLNTPAQAFALLSSSYTVPTSIVLNGSNYELQIDAAAGDMTYNFWIKIRKISI